MIVAENDDRPLGVVVPMNPEMRPRKYRYGTRPSGDHVYVVRWPDGVTKVGWSWYPSRWRGFISKGASLAALMSSDYYEIRDLESKCMDVLYELGPAAFATRHEAVAHLGSQGGGYLECRVLDDAAFLTLCIFLSGIPQKAEAV